MKTTGATIFYLALIFSGAAVWGQGTTNPSSDPVSTCLNLLSKTPNADVKAYCDSLLKKSSTDICADYKKAAVDFITALSDAQAVLPDVSPSPSAKKTPPTNKYSISDDPKDKNDLLSMLKKCSTSDVNTTALADDLKAGEKTQDEMCEDAYHGCQLLKGEDSESADKAVENLEKEIATLKEKIDNPPKNDQQQDNINSQIEGANNSLIKARKDQIDNDAEANQEYARQTVALNEKRTELAAALSNANLAISNTISKVNTACEAQAEAAYAKLKSQITTCLKNTDPSNVACGNVGTNGVANWNQKLKSIKQRQYAYCENSQNSKGQIQDARNAAATAKLNYNNQMQILAQQDAVNRQTVAATIQKDLRAYTATSLEVKQHLNLLNQQQQRMAMTALQNQQKQGQESNNLTDLQNKLTIAKQRQKCTAGNTKPDSKAKSLYAAAANKAQTLNDACLDPANSSCVNSKICAAAGATVTKSTSVTTTAVTDDLAKPATSSGSSVKNAPANSTQAPASGSGSATTK